MILPCGRRRAKNATCWSTPQTTGASFWTISSSLPAWLSDGLCRLATGGGHSARQLYSDGEEFTLAVKRPVILTGIDDVATHPDLAERALQIELETLPDNRRMPERELWRRFEAARPVIFSVILNALSCALHELPNVRLDALPRMADAALWATSRTHPCSWTQRPATSACNRIRHASTLA